MPRRAEDMRREFGEKAYLKYGFVDAFNPATGWYNADVLGIDVGPSRADGRELSKRVCLEDVHVERGSGPRRLGQGGGLSAGWLKRSVRSSRQNPRSAQSGRAVTAPG